MFSYFKNVFICFELKKKRDDYFDELIGGREIQPRPWAVIRKGSY